MEIAKNTIVSLVYTLRETDSTGEVIEQVGADEPLLFLFDAGVLFPAFENNLAGKKTGDEFDFILKTADAYGDFNEANIVYLPIENFIVDGVLQKEMLEVGLTLVMNDADGDSVRATVLEVAEDKVKMDFNHLLAGKDLHFVGKIAGVRAATAEEIDHGHAHDSGNECENA